MARQTRWDLSGLPQHIIQRGNHRANIFPCADDYRAFRRSLFAASRQHDVAVHAYALMSNHVHLLATPGASGAIGRMMQAIGCRYAQYFNRRYGRGGTLWEGRYRAAVLEVDGYLLPCYRYIELNPVRAELVQDPAAFRWSSHRGNLGLVDDELIIPHPLLATLGTTSTGRRLAYLRLFDQALDAQTLREFRDCTNKGWPLGGEAFKRQLATLGGQLTGPRSRGCEPGNRRQSATALESG